MGVTHKLSWAGLFREPYRMNTHATPNKLGRVYRCNCFPGFRRGDSRHGPLGGNPHHTGAANHDKRWKGKK